MPLKITAISIVLALGLADQALADQTTIIGPNGGVVHRTDTPDGFGPAHDVRPSHGVVVIHDDRHPVVRRRRCHEGPKGNAVCSVPLRLDDDPKRVIILGD